MKKIKRKIVSIISIVGFCFSVLLSAAAVVVAQTDLPLHPYGPWRVSCQETFNRTLQHPDGTPWDVASTDTWSAVLDNAAALEKTSIRCWCKSDVRHEWDSEELGPGNGWWTLIDHLVENGQICDCPAGQSIMVEMDHNTCAGTEVASGFFHCDGCSALKSGAKKSSFVSWKKVLAIGVGGILLLAD